MGSQDKRAPGAGGFDETAVVNRARNGDFRAFTELVERYEASVFRLMRHFTRSQREAEEALQEAFLEAWEDLGELQGQSEFRPWLIRIAVRQARKRLREQQNGRTVWLDETGEVAGETAPQELPDRALESLHPDLRAVFVLRDMEGIRAEDTAAMLQLTVQAVRGRLLRARMQVQERLSPYFKRNPFEAQAGQTQFCPRVLS